jgi:NAD(P)H-hydrate epimerase
MRPLSRAEVRSVDEQAVKLGLPTLVLMENAGRGAAEWLRELADPGARVLLACGPGNNGGDGGVVARHLDAWGFSVRVTWFVQAERITGDAATQKLVLENSGVAQSIWHQSTDSSQLDTLFGNCDWVVDGLLGTGLTRPVEGLLHAVIEAMNRAGRPVLALDLPSGLDADLGQAQGIAVRATATATFVAPKRGFFASGASAFTGPVRVVEIGVPGCILAPYQDGA